MPAMPAAETAPANVGPTPDLPVYSAMEVQQGGVIEGGRFANPSSLANELLGSLRGFMERAERVKQRISAPVGQVEAGGGPVRIADASNVTLVSLHGGPARQSLNPTETAVGRTGSGEPTNSVEHLQQVSDELFDAVVYRMESSLIGHGASHLSTSINTLLKGQ
jgi:hypothetical protein